MGTFVPLQLELHGRVIVYASYTVIGTLELPREVTMVDDPYDTFPKADPSSPESRRFTALRLKAIYEKEAFERRQQYNRDQTAELKERMRIEAEIARAEQDLDGQGGTQGVYVRKLPDRTPTGRVRRSHAPSDPRFDRFTKGDLVQVSTQYLKRQRKSSFRKTETSRAIYYGPATASGMAYIDWFVSEPWDHLKRDRVHIKYLQPLGTPR
jgi:hypothetical protein